MKKYIYFLVLVKAVLFLSSNHFLGGDPVLPPTPYSYNIPSTPDHLDSTGFGIVEDTVLSFIDDNTATLGRVLFYDELLSANGDIACATCHIQEFPFGDTLAFSHGISAPTARNSMHLDDLGWTNNSTYFWDMRL